MSIRYRQFHASRTNACGSLGPIAGAVHCLPPVSINHPLQLVRGGHLDAYTLYLEDCCRTATLPLPGYEPWAGFLAGPQGPKYRHLKLQDSTSGPTHFYHLNCEHGTGEAICEFERATAGVDVFGFKTEGNFVSLWVKDSAHVRLLGTGGCGCSGNGTAYPAGYARGFPPSLYRFENVSHFVAANVMDQASLYAPEAHPHGPPPPDMFNETECLPYNIIADVAGPEQGGGGGGGGDGGGGGGGGSPPAYSVLSRPLDRPVLVKRGGGGVRPIP